MNLQENIERIHEIMGVLMEDDKKYLYHGTSYDNAINIIDNGFNENTYWGDKSTAEQYAYSYDNPVLIKVEMNQIYDLLEPNYTLISYYEENMEDDDEYKDIIDLWGESDGTIEDSLNIFDSVILPPTYLQLSKENIMNLQENIERIHEIMGVIKEGLHDTSWENDEGDKITLMDLLNVTEDIPVRNISVAELKPHLLSWDGDEEEIKKVESADLQYPILIFVNDDGEFITLIDGHHRAQKAVRRGLERIKAKVIPINSLPKDIRKVFGHLGQQEEMRENELTERYWKGYTQKGMKTMFGKRYPNCVKKTK